MSFFNPLASTLLPGTIAQQALAAEKSKQVRRANAVARDVAPQSDRADQQVENVEEPTAADKDGSRQPRSREDARKARAKDQAGGECGRGEAARGDETGHIDVKA